jgi:hypothetical protein
MPSLIVILVSRTALHRKQRLPASLPEKGSSMPSHESSMRNLEKARARWRRPRPWRSSQEAQMIRRFVFWWLTSRGRRPSGRTWARDLGVSHTWLQKLVRELMAEKLSENEPKMPDIDIKIKRRAWSNLYVRSFDVQSGEVRVCAQAEWASKSQMALLIDVALKRFVGAQVPARGIRWQGLYSQNPG